MFLKGNYVFKSVYSVLLLKAITEQTISFTMSIPYFSGL